MTSEPTQGGARSEELLRTATKIYHDMSAALEASAARLSRNDDPETRKLAEHVREHWKALQTLLTLEIDLEKRDRERAGIVHDYALDLARARSEIRGRLDRLKGAAADREFPGGVVG